MAQIPTRQQIRQFYIQLVSANLALQHIYKTLFNEKGILIEDSRGSENYYIGTGLDGKRPFSIFFTNLRSIL